MKIAVIGAGWYGCHLAQVMLQKGYEVDIFEKNGSAISGASKKNQNRLHLGFHYPRNHETRKQSKEGFDWFIEHYSSLTQKIDNNIYAIPNKKSNIDFETFKIVMDGTKLNYDTFDKKIVEDRFGFKNLSGYIKCDERVVRNDLASKYFDGILGNIINYNTYVDLSNQDVVIALESKYDYIINCTWGATGQIPGVDYFFEPCIYFYYKNKKNSQFALTIMDGLFYSLYPYYENLYTLTSVEHTPLGKFDKINEALISLNRAKNDIKLISEKRDIFECEFSKYYPDFKNDFEFDSVEFSMKTKVVSSTDYRGCFVRKSNKIITVFSGKIDTLHIAENLVMEIVDG